MIIASFDIGKCNFSFCIEEIDQSVLESIVNIKKEDRYNVNGTCKTDFNNLLDEILKLLS